MPNKYVDHYQSLGLGADATLREIKRAYRRQALDAHPDKVGDEGADRIRALNEAYRILSDADERRRFDQVKEVMEEGAEEEDFDAVLREKLSASGAPYSTQFKRQHGDFAVRHRRKPMKQGLVARFFTELAGTDCDLRRLLTGARAAFHQVPALVKLIGDRHIGHLGFFDLATNFAQKQAALPLAAARVFQSDDYRGQLKAVLHRHWVRGASGLTRETIRLMDGREETELLVSSLGRRLIEAQGAGNAIAGIKNLLRNVKLMLQFEKSIHEKDSAATSADDLRELAWHLLDWIPAFSGKMPASVLTNIFRRAGMYLQLASQLETRQRFQMADERLAFQLYAITFSVGHHGTPDVEQYNLLHGLKLIAQFRFHDDQLVEVVKAFQHRAEVLFDVFPFTRPMMPGVTFLKEEREQLTAMRHYLRFMVTCYKGVTGGQQIDIPKVTVFYRAYEACVKNWYMDEHDESVEKQLRLDLMRSLLEEKGWGFEEVEDSVVFSGTSIHRGPTSWMQSFSPLENPVVDQPASFQSVDGVKLNFKTGQVEILTTPSGVDTPDCFRVLSSQDIHEFLTKNIAGAIFSLDPVDPDMDYHPFNFMRFGPARLYQTRFLETLLSTDYILKFLTVGQEVQGVYPFDVRSLGQLTRDLPAYLKRIIENFQKEQQAESLHRFWIEAETQPVVEDRSHLEDKGQLNFKLMDVKMVVRKHMMKRDAHGNLVDDDEAHEGWFVYVLSLHLRRAFESGRLEVRQPAMLFLAEGVRVFFLEKEEKTAIDLPRVDSALQELRRCRRKSANGAVVEDSHTRSLLFGLVSYVAKFAGRPSYFSKEYVFAQKFTDHYEEFALYYPEFRRLQELSRLTTLVRVLNNVREGNKATLKQLAKKRSHVDEWLNYGTFSSGNPHKESFDKLVQAIADDLGPKFSAMARDLSFETVKSEKISMLSDMRGKIGSLTFGLYSSEVNRACEATVNDNISRLGYAAEYQIRSQVDGMRGEIAAQFSRTKRSQYREQLSTVFADAPGVTDWDIDHFLDNYDYDSIARSLATREISVNKKQIATSLGISDYELDNCLAGRFGAVRNIATNKAKIQFRSHMQQMQAELERVRSGRARLEQQFVMLGLGSNEAEIDLAGRCLWVPANVRHQVSKAGHASRFVYGGVRVQPKIMQTRASFAAANYQRVNAAQLARAAQASINRKTAYIRSRGYQEHHIVSHTNVATKNHPLIAAAGSNLQARFNKMFLPKHAETHPTRSIHRGKHTKAHSEFLARKMDAVYQHGRRANWTREQYNAGLRSVVAQERANLRSGHVPLNKVKRDWAT
jgi:curved DNA-binding protein CbpA/mannose-6-phosphate isomerase-like protein (cupin superfamily)